MPPLSSPRYIDFGPPIRGVTAYLYNLPEVASTHECMRVPTVSARFATAPIFWNWAMVAVARLAPKGFLEDRNKCAHHAAAPTPYSRVRRLVESQRSILNQNRKSALSNKM